MAVGKEQLNLLKKLCRCRKAAARKALFDRGGQPLQRALREVAHNVLKGNVKLSKGQFKKLSKHKKTVRELAKKRLPLKVKKALHQKGGFLPALLLPVLGSLASALLGKVL